eukprot:Nk52_evm14s1992 gene=Nk52_evmTU14s1992
MTDLEPEQEVEASVLLKDTPNSYIIRPNYKNKFKPREVKTIIREYLAEKLTDYVYNADEIAQMTKDITDDLREKLEDMNVDRYKYVVQVVIGERRGEGVKMGVRCFWDSDTDNCAKEIFTNDSIFCVAAVFGVFFY